MFSVQDANTVFTLSDAAADKVRSLIEAEGNPDLVLRVAAAGALGPDEVIDAGREQGEADAVAVAPRLDPAAPDAEACLDGLVGRLDALGFDPALAADGDQITVAFAHCPFRELAETNPEIVCALHQGLVDGFVTTLGGVAVESFHPLTDRTPCQVDLALTPS